MNSIEKFILRVSERTSSNTVYNQYTNMRQLSNLKNYLELQSKNNPIYLFIGEASGHLGCRESGIGFTSGSILASNKLYSTNRTLFNFEMIKAFKESSSTIVYTFFNENPKVFKKSILFNAFPFHPHKENQEKSNRTPNKTEIEEGLLYLKELCILFNFEKYFCIGNIAFRIINEAITKALIEKKELIKLRHPSHGGKNLFLGQLRTHFKIKQYEWKDLI